MKRKCDHCDREATVHEVVIHDGVKIEKHLCEEHAREQGIAVQPQAPISELITKFVMTTHTSEEKHTKHEAKCPSCGLDWTRFRQRGLLGCGQCYAAFEEELGPLIERAHQGGTHHVGKSPQRCEGLLDREQRISAIRQKLNHAVASEEYELAASLRDELMQVEDHTSGEDISQ